MDYLKQTEGIFFHQCSSEYIYSHITSAVYLIVIILN